MSALIIPLRTGHDATRAFARVIMRQAEEAAPGTPCPYGWAEAPSLVRAAWREGQYRAQERAHG